jgi:hypothetical protein
MIIILFPLRITFLTNIDSKDNEDLDIPNDLDSLDDLLNDNDISKQYNNELSSNLASQTDEISSDSMESNLLGNVLGDIEWMDYSEEKTEKEMISSDVELSDVEINQDFSNPFSETRENIDNSEEKATLILENDDLNQFLENNFDSEEETPLESNEDVIIGR